ncbi:unnamed protein product [Mytilus coruscus]|uniref:IgGFc-binding protein N-terminal domain-containing protein n=1 Tax=Mytilus coruscus TaxID=42192 RepID=A0A6J8C087_MYTCO|nr:unnamed protein product [Mytilus coruscus]
MVLSTEIKGKKMYMRVHHRQHYEIINEFEEQQFVRLRPGGHFKRELDEYFSSLEKKTNTNQDERKINGNKELENELRNIPVDGSKPHPFVKITRKHRTGKPWHSFLTEKLKRIKHYITSKLFSKENSTHANDQRYNNYNMTEKNNITDENSIAVRHNDTKYLLEKILRVKRSKNYVDANQDWELQYSTTGKPASTTKYSFKVDTKDIKEADKSQIKFILKMIFVTLGSILLISLIAYCFVKDPKTCIIAFGSGCPCLLYMCPCLMNRLKMYLEPNKIVQDQMNTYMPGLIIHEDGKLENYKPTPEEMECILDIVDIIGGPGTILSNIGIEIRSDEEIYVYAVNKLSHSTDAFVVFPVDTLGDNYYVITWSEEAEFMIFATEQNTSVNIVIAKGTYITYNSVTYTYGMTLNITMNRYQTFHVYGGPDYSGTRIISNEPITLITGALCTSIGQGSCDHVSSPMTPIETFGNTFVTINMPNCNRPVNFKIVTSDFDTDVNITGIASVSLDKPVWKSIDGSDDLQVTDINVTNGAHTVYHVNPTVTFLAVSTGLAHTESYAYSSGQRLARINSNCTQSMTVPGDIIDNDCDGLIDEEL